MPTVGTKSTWRQFRRALIISGITAATLLVLACGNTYGNAQQQEVIAPPNKTGDGIGTDNSTAQKAINNGSSSRLDNPILAAVASEIGSAVATSGLSECESGEGTTIEIIQSGVAGSAFETSDTSQDCAGETPLSDGQKSTVTSLTAPSGVEPMTAEEIQMFLDLPEVKNGIVLVPKAQSESISPAPSATPIP